MKGPELSPRLRAIADQVPQGARLADIGTDHAYLPVALLCTGAIRSAVASDVREGPLQRGRETAQRHGVAQGLIFRRCDGLKGLDPSEADTIVIAGMGGELIARILAAAAWTREALLLLQPMSGQPELRRWLNENGYQIVRETLAREGTKLYVILTVQGEQETPPYTPAECWAGRQSREIFDPLRLDYLTDQIQRRRRALAGMERGYMVSEEQREETRDLIAQLEAMREEWRAWQR